MMRNDRPAMTFLISAGLTLALTLGWGARDAAASSILDVAAATQGCFGTGCTTFGTSVDSTSTFGLHFDAASPFDVTTSGGSATDITLGTIGRGNVNVSTADGTLDFLLQVTFSLPLGIAGGPNSFTALINGTNFGGGGAVIVDFDNTWQTISFTNAAGSGSFEFAVINDLSLSKNTLATPGSILAGIQNATFTPATIDPPAAVPEPTTLLLLGTGLAGVVARRRLKR